MKKDLAESKLKRELSLIDAVGIGLGAVIGAGIFVVSGVAAEIAGPAMLISLLIAGLAAWIPWLGFILCLLMAFSLPVQSILLGLILLTLGHFFRLIFKATIP